MRVLAIDYGDQRIGLALSDERAMLCGRAWTVQEWDLARTVEKIADAAKENQAGILVLGLPKNMDGSEGARAEKTRTVQRLLEEATGLTVALWDERRSSIEAHAILHANGRREKKHRKTVDAVAASLILEGWLGAHGSEVRE